MSTKRIQKIEIDQYDLPIHCPVCGHRVLGGAESEEAEVSPCRHTLFVAHDEGFEYRSPLFDKTKGIEGIPSEEIDPGEDGYDGFTDALSLKNAMKISVFMPAPSFLGAYIGFVFED